MKKPQLLGTACACLVGLSFNANAVVLNTLNGIDYEWLELTATVGINRNDVQAQICDNHYSAGLFRDARIMLPIRQL